MYLALAFLWSHRHRPPLFTSRVISSHEPPLKREKAGRENNHVSRRHHHHRYRSSFQNEEKKKTQQSRGERERETGKTQKAECNNASTQAIIKKQQQVRFYCNKFKSFAVMAAPPSRNKAPARLSSSPLLWIIALASLTLFILYKIIWHYKQKR
uniref:Uncharacterized protein n=1 Tax=Salix viminalis TaxID=40686 RepID=A0A6N2MKQ2_SALVM